MDADIYISVYLASIYETKLVMFAFSPLYPSINMFAIYIHMSWYKIFYIRNKSPFDWITLTIFLSEIVLMAHYGWNSDFFAQCATSKTFVKWKLHSFYHFNVNNNYIQLFNFIFHYTREISKAFIRKRPVSNELYNEISTNKRLLLMIKSIRE